MMHFVCTFLIVRAQGIRLIAMEEVQSYGKILHISYKTLLKMAGWRMYTPSPHPCPCIRP